MGVANASGPPVSIVSAGSCVFTTSPDMLPMRSPPSLVHARAEAPSGVLESKCGDSRLPLWYTCTTPESLATTKYWGCSLSQEMSAMLSQVLWEAFVVPRSLGDGEDKLLIRKTATRPLVWKAIATRLWRCSQASLTG